AGSLTGSGRNPRGRSDRCSAHAGLRSPPGCRCRTTDPERTAACHTRNLRRRVTWPVLSPGPVYRAAFPDRGQPVARAEIASLGAFGFPQAVMEAWAGEIPRLNQLQLDAINEYG